MNNDIQPEQIKVEPFPNIKQCFILVGMLVVGMIAFSPITIVATLIPLAFVKEVSVFVYYLLSFGTASFLIYLYKKNKEKHTYINPQLKIDDFVVVPLAMIAAIALLICVSMPIISIIPMPEFMKTIFESASKDLNNFWAYATVIVLAPILEEYIFRGVILDGLLKRFSPAKAILISSLFFGLIHFNPWQFVSAMVIGIFAGWIYYRTKNLLLCILIHFANNAWAMVSNYIIPNDSSTNMYPTNELIYIIPALVAALICIYLLKIRLYPKEDKDSMVESVE